MDYRSRAAFKLLELDARYSLLKPDMKVLEVGSAPGSWTQVLTQRLQKAERPSVISVDVLEMKPVAGSTFIQGDIEDPKVNDAIYKALDFAKVDLVHVRSPLCRYVRTRLLSLWGNAVSTT